MQKSCDGLLRRNVKLMESERGDGEERQERLDSHGGVAASVICDWQDPDKLGEIRKCAWPAGVGIGWKIMSREDPGFQAALDEARQGAQEGGVPIGACLVGRDGQILGRGHNMRIQKGSAILHAEMSALENAGRLPGSAYKGATMYTTLSPCDMCTGACIMYGVARVVMGENKTFVGGEAYLRARGVEVVNLEVAECERSMERFIREHPGEWFEDIGEEK